jgi:uncharacterized protein (DUF433 family)
MRRGKRREYGEYIVSDPEICHGQLTFKGTRIMVKSVLFYVAEGKDWERKVLVFVDTNIRSGEQLGVVLC